MGRRLDAWVLPLAAVIAVALLRWFCSSWREAVTIALIAAVLHLAAGVVAAMIPDGSWDGLAYHQEAVIRLAAGWNPLFEDAANYGRGAEIYLNHYPKGPWITAAAVLNSTGHIEAGKLFNLTLMIAAGTAVMAALLRLSSLRPLAATVVATLIAFNPVFIYQSGTFYVDGALGSVLTVMVAALVMFVASGKRQTLAIALAALCLTVNLKFTGIAYAAILMACAVIVVWRVKGFRRASQLAASGAIAGVLGIAVLGYAPYVRNTIERGAPFYPVNPPPAHRPDLLHMQRPANLTDENRVTRFFISNFSRTEAVRPPQGSRLKFPFSIARDEWRGVYGADVEAGGFGPLYGALLIVAAGAAIVLLSSQATRPPVSAALLIAACLCASIFVHSETWLARFVPQAWLLPMPVVICALSAPHRSRRWFGYALAGLATLNILIVGANVAWRQLTYARLTSQTLQEIAASPGPVFVYPHTFTSLRRRLIEKGIKFQLVDTPPPDHVGRVIPTPGNQTFWYESR